jgi:hypothetical protein
VLEECPHCYTGVFPSDAGECPSCRKNVRDRSGTDPLRTALDVSETVSLPPYCCECDAPTERVVRVKSKIPGQGESGNETIWILALLAVFFSFFAPLIGLFARAGEDRRAGRSGETFIVHLPQCDTCGSVRAPKPIRVDRERQTLTFVVHVDFKRRVTSAA